MNLKTNFMIEDPHFDRVDDVPQVSSRFKIGDSIITIKEYRVMKLVIFDISNIQPPGYPEVLLSCRDSEGKVFHVFEDCCISFEGFMDFMKKLLEL